MLYCCNMNKTKTYRITDNMKDSGRFIYVDGIWVTRSQAKALENMTFTYIDYLNNPGGDLVVGQNDYSELFLTPRGKVETV